jgi:uncharacterized protein
MKKLKIWRCLLLGLLLAAGSAAVWGEKVATMPAPTGYVDDYAGVISGPAKTELEALCVEVHDKTKAQVFLVTVKTLEGEEAQTFANQLFHNWKVGEKKTDRGILLLFAIQDHKRWIEVGYGFEGILNDAKVGDIGREMVPSLQAAKYDDAVRIGVRDVAKAIAADAGVTLDTLGGDATPETTEAQPVAADQTPIKPGRVILAATPFVLFFCLFGFLVWRQVKRGVGFGGGGGSGSDSGSSSGDSSSSSDSFSGGDGGDSGGGGAGGSW